MMFIAAVAVVLMMSACGGKTGKSASNTDSVPADSMVMQEASIDKHTEDYLRERVDSFYSVYKNPKYEKSGHRIYNDHAGLHRCYGTRFQQQKLC